MASTQSHFNSFDAIYNYLTSTRGYPVLPVASPYPHDKSLSHSISSLSLHPTLEAILHILNSDLPSAHFLCRHMQNEPAWEGMYIHGLLHRVEGDYDNVRAWYANVAESEVFRNCWSEPDGSGFEAAMAYIGEVEKLKKQKLGDEKALETRSRREFESLVEWCKAKFGTDAVADATSAWVEPSEKHREMASKMIVGGEGWRQF